MALSAVQGGRVSDDRPSGQGLLDDRLEGEGNPGRGRQGATPLDEVEDGIVGRAAGGAVGYVGRVLRDRVDQADPGQVGCADVVQGQGVGQYLARGGHLLVHRLGQGGQGEPGDGTGHRLGQCIPGADALQAEPAVDHAVRGRFGLEPPDAPIGIGHDGPGGIVGRSDLIGIETAEEGAESRVLVGVRIVEGEGQSLQDVGPDQLVQYLRFPAEAGVQIVGVEGRGVILAVIPVADVLPGDEELPPAVQIIHQGLVGADVARRPPGVGPDDDVVGPQLLGGGNIGRVGDEARVVEVAGLIQSVLIVKSDVLPQPDVGVHQQEGGGQGQGEVLAGHRALGDANHRPLDLMPPHARL